MCKTTNIQKMLNFSEKLLHISEYSCIIQSETKENPKENLKGVVPHDGHGKQKSIDPSG